MSVPAKTPAPVANAAPVEVQAARVSVTETGFEPAQVGLHAGILARLTFVRTTDRTCATEVVFPSLNITTPLPLNEPVVIEFTPAATGSSRSGAA